MSLQKKSWRAVRCINKKPVCENKIAGTFTFLVLPKLGQYYNSNESSDKTFAINANEELIKLKNLNSYVNVSINNLTINNINHSDRAVKRQY